MKAARTSSSTPRTDVAAKPAPPTRAAAGEVERLIVAARQDYLDALPIAAATLAVGADGGTYVDCANEHFRHLAEWDERVGDRSIGRIKLLSGGTIGTRVADFLKGNEPALQFESNDGRPIGGRHFTVRLARLRPMGASRRRCLVSLIDKTAQVETEKNLRSEMLRDSLTGLPNRLAFNEHVENLIADSGFKDGNHAVLVVDMARFSRVNECMGSRAGDELLITFARRLFSALRPSDILARTSGDEFAILLRLDRGTADAMRAAERIKSVLTLPFRLSDLEITIDCAIGCAILTSNVATADEVLRNAQFALKLAKRSGVTQVYEPTQAQAERRRFSIETELRHAIEGDRLALAFQPLIELATGRVAGFEALARWDDEGEGSISPAEFIPVAEESGLIVQLGRWALNAAARTLAAWDSKAGAPLPFGISVNMSPTQIARDDVAGAVSAALGAARLPGNRLTLELTEGAIIQDPDRATRVLRSLQDLEVRIAMDDFGTGYTSLASLQRLPIDVLKIDRSFISEMMGGGDSMAIVRAILSLSNALGLETTAEGIDTAALEEAVGTLGCTYGQGYLYAPPLPPDEALAYWFSRSA